jgi:hypothetical protein
MPLVHIVLCFAIALGVMAFRWRAIEHVQPATQPSG